MSRIKYTVEKVLNNVYFQFPAFLIEGECKKLSNDARVLYTLLRNRHQLSVKNQWYNDKKEVYLIMTRESMCDLIGVSMKPVIKAVNELIDLGLLEEERQGQGKPNLIYLLEISETSEDDNSRPVDSTSQTRPVDSTGRTCRNTKSRPVDSTSQNMSNRQPNNRNHKNRNNLSYNKINQSFADDIDKTGPKHKIRYESNDFNYIQKAVESNIDLNALKERYPEKARELQELFEIIVEILMSHKNSLRLAKEEIPANIVKQAFASLNFFHLEYVIQCLSRNTSQVKSTKAYLQTSLWNATKTMNNYYAFEGQNFVHEKFGLDPK